MSRLKPLINPQTITSEVAPSLRNIPTAHSTTMVNALEPPVTPPVVVADAKSPLNSKMTWLGAVLTAIGALQLLQEMKLIDMFIPDPQTRDMVTAGLLFVGGVLTIYLRVFHTFRPTTLTKVKLDRGVTDNPAGEAGLFFGWSYFSSSSQFS